MDIVHARRESASRDASQSKVCPHRNISIRPYTCHYPEHRSHLFIYVSLRTLRRVQPRARNRCQSLTHVIPTVPTVRAALIQLA